ncbi:MAG: GTP-binding protein, partial [Patescibacteria group bacterium]
METRPPVVGIFGHIDHGKSSLLDYIRKSNVVATEAGGITQHISAYEVLRSDGRKITFLDTPGHEAFQGVRTRGANVADIAVLVVSGEDGVKPQTLEVYKYIKESGLPFIIAITKMDKPTADVEKTKQNLAENDIYVEGYGGDVSFVPLSAKTGAGVEDLLEMIVLTPD